MATLDVRPVRSRRDREAFIRLPWSIYRGDPNWVPPLLGDARKTLAPTYPFFEHGEAEWFLAWRGDRPVARITAHVNHTHLAKFNDGRGFFGWFECENDQATSDALFGAAIDWLLARKLGLTHVRGPLNWDLNGENPGILLADQSEPGLPVVLMAYSAPWYAGLVEAAGFGKSQDLFAYSVTDGPDIDDKLALLQKLANLARRRLPELNVRRLDVKSGYRRDMDVVRTLFNEAWADNWGSTDLTQAEIGIIADGLKPVARPELTSIISIGDRPVGCLVCIPDINPILKRIDGKLFPFGWFTFLTKIKTITSFRTILLGVASEFRGKGIDAVLISETINAGRESGFSKAELSWVLESNHGMNSIASKLGHVYRRYRIYEREL